MTVCYLFGHKLTVFLRVLSTLRGACQPNLRGRLIGPRVLSWELYLCWVPTRPCSLPLPLSSFSFVVPTVMPHFSAFRNNLCMKSTSQTRPSLRYGGVPLGSLGNLTWFSRCARSHNPSRPLTDCPVVRRETDTERLSVVQVF